MPVKYWDSITYDPATRQVIYKRSSKMLPATLVLTVALSLLGYAVLSATPLPAPWGLSLGLVPLLMSFLNKGGRPLISQGDGGFYFHENYGERLLPRGGEFICFIRNACGDSYETEIRYVYPSGTYLFFQSDEYVSETAFKKLFAHLGEKLSWETKKIS
ncbi:MAG: hypothetical protein Q7Q73_06950 [Verrucomicrobiota bacterium JB024]|nr:hypothetical protein [Verrucomicrobiota bacterium JB024]